MQNRKQSEVEIINRAQESEGPQLDSIGEFCELLSSVSASEREALLCEFIEEEVSHRVTLGKVEFGPVPGSLDLSDPLSWIDDERFFLLHQIGQGGTGVVLKALDLDLNRAVAIKVLRPEFCGDKEQRLRFCREASVIARLQHPGMPPIYEMGQSPNGCLYFSMKLLQGKHLGERLMTTRPEKEYVGLNRLGQWLGVLERVASTIAYAHRLGIVHRDIKPSNIMVGEFDDIQVLDWGVAKVASQQKLSAATDRDEIDLNLHLGLPDDDGPPTLIGSVLGTACYMPPEQAKGGFIDASSDVFSLGAILLEILIGVPPFDPQSQTPGEVIEKLKTGDEPDNLSRLGDSEHSAIPQELQALVRRCLNYDREKRPADAGEFLAALKEYRENVERNFEKTRIDKALVESKIEEERKLRNVKLLTVVTSLVALMVGMNAYFQDQKVKHNRMFAEVRVINLSHQFREFATTNYSERFETYVKASSLIVEHDLSGKIAGVEEEMTRWYRREREKGRFYTLVENLEESRLRSSGESYRSFRLQRKYEEVFEGIGINSESTVDRVRMIYEEIGPEMQPLLVLSLERWYLAARMQDDDESINRIIKFLIELDTTNRAIHKARAEGGFEEFKARVARKSGYSADQATVWVREIEYLGDDESARQLALKVQKLAPDRFWPNCVLGVLLERQGEYANALRYLKTANLISESAGVHKFIGLCYRGMNDSENEIASYRKAISEDDVFIGARLLLWESLLEQGEYEEASRMARVLGEMRGPGNASKFAVLLRKSGYPIESLRIPFNAGDENCSLNKFYALFDLGRYSEAIDAAVKHRQQFGHVRDSDSFYQILAMAYYLSGRGDDALSDSGVADRLSEFRNLSRQVQVSSRYQELLTPFAEGGQVGLPDLIALGTYAGGKRNFLLAADCYVRYKQEELDSDVENINPRRDEIFSKYALKAAEQLLAENDEVGAARYRQYAISWLGDVVRKFERFDTAQPSLSTAFQRVTNCNTLGRIFGSQGHDQAGMSNSEQEAWEELKFNFAALSPKR